jgi:hypothetical protein
MNILSKLINYNWVKRQLKRDDALIKQWVKDNPNGSDEEFKKWWDAEVEKDMARYR